jgi:3-deoxy-D-manno-octulosonic-acid transferase
LADAVYYLPLDTAANAKHFIETLQPEMAVFTKYEYWYHFFNLLHQHGVPLYIISGIFRPGQVFFKWYGGLHRKMLHMVSHFFVQDEASKQLLQTLNINQITVSGDTRFDRVWENAQNPKQLPLIEKFKSGRKIFIAGSTWPKDEALLVKLLELHPDWRFIFAPHEVGEDKMDGLIKLLPPMQFIRFKQMENYRNVADHRILIVDNIGMLSSLYQYAEVAYIGGGYGAGIHNTLEAAAFGIPVIFGPKYQKFKEARDLIDIKAGFSVNTADDLIKTADKLMNDADYRVATGARIKEYVSGHTGATDAIVGYIG